MDAFTVAFKSMALALDSFVCQCLLFFKDVPPPFPKHCIPFKEHATLAKKKVYFRVKLNRMLALYRSLTILDYVPVDQV